MKINFFSKYKSIIAFLIIEIMALVSFMFANINEVLFIISSLLSVVALVFSLGCNTEKKDFIKLIPVVAGLFVISGITAFGGLSSSVSQLSNIATFFALPGFFSLGFFLRRLGSDIKPEYVILAIGGGLAAVTLVSTIATWADYGLFYGEIHKAKPIYFYDGTAYNVTKEMNWLIGFKISEVTLEYGGMFALLCSIFLPVLILLNPKKDKNIFIPSAVFGSIGFISLISIPNWRGIIFLAIVSLFAFVYKFLKQKMVVVNILSLVVVCIVGLGVVFYLVSIINAGIGFKFTGIFSKLFCENFLMRTPSDVLAGAFAKDINGTPYNLFGFDIYNPNADIVADKGLLTILYEPTYIFEYEIMKEVGLIGTLFVMAFFAAMFVFVVRYIRDSKDSAFLKNSIVMMLVAFMLFASFGFEVVPQTHDTTIYQPFLRSVPFMIALFLFGYTYFVPKEEQAIKEHTIEEATL